MTEYNILCDKYGVKLKKNKINKRLVLELSCVNEKYKIQEIVNINIYNLIAKINSDLLDKVEIINKYDHLHLWKNFRVADEWYHYNILRHYDPNIKENTIQDTPPTSFMYIKGTPHPSEINTLKEFNDLKSLIPSLFIRKVSSNLNIEYKDITPPQKIKN